MDIERNTLCGEDMPSEPEFRARQRFHQCWWRDAVLAEAMGPRPGGGKKPIGSMIANGQESGGNFLSASIRTAVEDTLRERAGSHGRGAVETSRLYNNLLSSQPLCFNFFGELKADPALALQVLRKFWPGITEVHAVLFEHAPDRRLTDDNSAFDVAFEVTEGGSRGIIGLECKYTDTFSPAEHWKERYREVFERSGGRRFAAGSEELTASRFNQLFRSELMAEAMVQEGLYAFARTGLFCHPDDTEALETGRAFGGMLAGGRDAFTIITYSDFIAEMQQLLIGRELRETTMKLWARYCGSWLSENRYR